MSNLLSIEVRKVQIRHAPDETYNEIVAIDEYETLGINLGSEEAPTNPYELLSLLLTRANNENDKMVDMIKFHIESDKEFELEGQWISWNEFTICNIINSSGIYPGLNDNLPI